MVVQLGDENYDTTITPDGIEVYLRALSPNDWYYDDKEQCYRVKEDACFENMPIHPRHDPESMLDNLDKLDGDDLYHFFSK